jgi:pilus assembly protein CpaB
MDRRFLTVLGVSLVFALVVSAVFYRIVGNTGRKEKPEEPDLKDLVVATKPLPVGVSIKPDDVKVIKLPSAQFPKGAFSKPEEVIDRPIISNILLDEAVIEGRLAQRGSGGGLAPIIPVGMRAVSVRVNEVVGVAGFVLPGMRVDVLVTGRPPGENVVGSVTTTVLQNIQVLSAGQTIQPDARGQAINAPVVTLLVSPEQAEILTLAGTEGRIQLVLRNGSDQGVEKTAGRTVAELFGGRKPKPEPEAEPKPRRRTVTVAAAPPPPPVVAPPPAPAPPEEVVMFRGTVRTVEAVGKKN